MNQEAYWKQLAYQKYDLTNCESEPLAFCGAIQDCGVFIGCDRQSGEVIAISMNAVERMGIDPAKALSQGLADILVFGDGSPFDSTLALQLSKSGPLLVKVKNADQVFAASVSQNKNLTCIDLEVYDQASDTQGHRSLHDPVQDLKHLVHLLDEAEGLQSITAKAVDQIRLITGFDRVMIYRFQPNWDGHVVAESMSGDYPPYLDLYFPASDIPAQARKIYYESKFRMIVDTQALPSPIATKKGIGKSEIDLSCSSFRASSPIHIQYLQNMGVRSSFSLPIKLNGELWGLVSCHSYGQTNMPSRRVRAACELAAQVLSGRIADSVSERRLRIRNQVFELTQSLLKTMTDGQTVIGAFENNEDALLHLTESTGAYVKIGDGEVCVGNCPPLDYIHQITGKLTNKHALALWETQSISEELDLPFLSQFAGAMAVPFSLGFDDLVIWFRPELIHEVKWGGKPREQAQLVKSLEPRASFAAWSETVKGKSRKWEEADKETGQYLLFTFVQGIFQKAADLSRANTELEKATKAKDEFIGMVSHELRTPLGVMIGWIDILKDYQFRDAEVIQALETIDRNAKLQINLINDLLDVSRIISGKMRVSPVPNVDVCTIAKDAVDALVPTADAKGVTIHCDCPCPQNIAADPERLRQIIWNLITNAIKFTPKGGSVTVDVTSRSSSVEIKVTDTGVGIPAHRLGSVFNRFEQINSDGSRTGGLGLGLSIVRSLTELHGGRVSAESAGEGKGSTFTVVLPVYALRSSQQTTTSVQLKPDISSSLSGLRILLAEDQEDSAQAMERLLRRQGAAVDTVGNGKSAFERLKNAKYDLLLSDIGMPEWDGYRLITEWRSLERERQAPILPAIALTAYATSQDRTKALQAGFQNHIPKPLDKNELLAVIHTLGIGKVKS